MKKEKISDAVIRRLPRYYRYLDELHTKGIVRISSGSLVTRCCRTLTSTRAAFSSTPPSTFPPPSSAPR